MTKNLILDFGRVLVGFDPYILYNRFFGDTAKASWFIRNVITEDWVRRLDIGQPFDECVRELQSCYPEYQEAIALYDTCYQEMVTGEIPGMYNLIRGYKAQGLKVYGLTNWSHKVYDVIRQYPVFALMDGMVISSEVHLLKPDVAIYQCLLDKYALKTEECVFVDDRAENVDSACRIGMEGVVFKAPEQLNIELSKII